MKWLSGRCLCCAAHGLSCLITTRTPSSQHTLLFDTGPDETIFERNVIRLGVDMGGVDAMMLSHGHWDHAGAMPRALQMMTLANGGRRVPTYMHPDMFASRAVKAQDGRLMPMEDIPSQHVLAANGADLIITRDEFPEFPKFVGDAVSSKDNDNVSVTYRLLTRSWCIVNGSSCFLGEPLLGYIFASSGDRTNVKAFSD